MARKKLRLFTAPKLIFSCSGGADVGPWPTGPPGADTGTAWERCSVWPASAARERHRQVHRGGM
jgi:hypothetical protein